MKRRDFIKTAPAAAMLPVVSHGLAEDAGAVESAAAKRKREAKGK